MREAVDREHVEAALVEKAAQPVRVELACGASGHPQPDAEWTVRADPRLYRDDVAIEHRVQIVACVDVRAVRQVRVAELHATASIQRRTRSSRTSCTSTPRPI